MRYLVKNKNTIMFAFAILLCAIIASCEDAKYDTIGSRIYLAESSSLSYESKKVTVAEEGSVVTVTPRSGQIATKDIEVTLGLSPKSLEVYNTKSGTNYKSMPEGSYSFDQKTVVIKKGELVAPTVKVSIDPLTKEMLDSGDKFALPVAITAVSGGQQTLEGADVMIYIMDQVIITSAPVLTGTKPITMEMRQDYTVTQWSLEMRINMSELGDGAFRGGQRKPGALFLRRQACHRRENGGGKPVGGAAGAVRRHDPGAGSPDHDLRRKESRKGDSGYRPSPGF